MKIANEYPEVIKMKPIRVVYLFGYSLNSSTYLASAVPYVSVMSLILINNI